ncbi:hypothetical protein YASMINEVIRUS_792 [Yasminevirus sp. GU-2018]|uniref:Uncharacterized protein n=1 Tax=Yasminevirus sp. GU-2018 TaxID=2420051 RepID=A0A5K0U894_9VIRU|nr:hypothetical protein YASMINEVIRUS_792 [Yasminevirus sp. GU-2018]
MSTKLSTTSTQKVITKSDKASATNKKSIPSKKMIKDNTDENIICKKTVKNTKVLSTEKSGTPEKESSDTDVNESDNLGSDHEDVVNKAKRKREQKIEKTDDDNQMTSFVLKHNKTTGNYSVLRKSVVNGFSTLQRIRYVIYGAHLPFGKEIYNDNTILNAIVYESNNLNHNLIFILNRMSKTFSEMKNIESCKTKYSIGDKTFFPFIKEIDVDNSDGAEDSVSTVDDVDKKKKGSANIFRRYSIRLYMKYGAKITHSERVGELSCDQLKGKKCNIDVEIGSMWFSASTKMYGVNIHVTHITVVN